MKSRMTSDRQLQFECERLLNTYAPSIVFDILPTYNLSLSSSVFFTKRINTKASVITDEYRDDEREVAPFVTKDNVVRITPFLRGLGFILQKGDNLEEKLYSTYTQLKLRMDKDIINLLDSLATKKRHLNKLVGTFRIVYHYTTNTSFIDSNKIIQRIVTTACPRNLIYVIPENFNNGFVIIRRPVRVESIQNPEIEPMVTDPKIYLTVRYGMFISDSSNIYKIEV